MDGMNGKEYETWCTQYLRRQGFRHIRTTSASGDQGIDIIAERHGKTYGIQCKYYSRPVGNAAVQEAYAGMTYYHCDSAAVMTNASFTRSARSLAEETGVELWEHAGPEEKQGFFLIKRIPALITFLAGVYFFAVAAGQPLAEVQKDLTVLVFSLLSSLTAFVFKDRYGASVFSAVCSLIYLACDVGALHTQRIILYVLQVILLIIILIFMVIMKKERDISSLFEEKEELQAMISETLSRLSEDTADLISEELHCPVKVISARKNADKSCTIQLHATRNVDDQLALLQFTLNQYAQYENAQLSYELSSQGTRDFTVTIRNM